MFCENLREQEEGYTRLCVLIRNCHDLSEIQFSKIEN